MLIGWAGLRPRNDESAGKIRSRKTLHGNKYLRKMLIQVAWSAALSNKSFLGNKYRQLSARMKSQKALLAIARKLLVITFEYLIFANIASVIFGLFLANLRGKNGTLG